jgi:hypothetical protein
VEAGGGDPFVKLKLGDQEVHSSAWSSKLSPRHEHIRAHGEVARAGQGLTGFIDTATGWHGSRKPAA